LSQKGTRNRTVTQSKRKRSYGKAKHSVTLVQRQPDQNVETYGYVLKCCSVVTQRTI